jgi:hypothetical protein
MKHQLPGSRTAPGNCLESNLNVIPPSSDFGCSVDGGLDELQAISSRNRESKNNLVI